MKRKLFCLLTLLLAVCSGAWAEEFVTLAADGANKLKTWTSGNFSVVFTTSNDAQKTYVKLSADDTGLFATTGSETITRVVVIYGTKSGSVDTNTATITVPSTSDDTKFTASTTNNAVTITATAQVYVSSTKVYYTTGGGGSSYTVTYNANGGSGSMADSEGASITLSANTFTAPTGYTFDGWNTAANGSGTAYTDEQSGITTNLGLFAQWKQTVTLDKNGGTVDGSVVAYYNGTLGAVTAPTYADHTVTGYYNDAEGTTKVLNADGSFAAENVTGYITAGAWTHSGATTLYAQWEEAVVDYSWSAKNISGSLSSGDEVETSTGGKMTYTPLASGKPTLKYSSTSGKNCVEFGGDSNCQVTVVLNKKLQPGSVITLEYYVHSASDRGFYLATAGGTNVKTFSQKVVDTYTENYTVVADDGLDGSREFKLKRYNNAYLNSVTVSNCADVSLYNITLDRNGGDGDTDGSAVIAVGDARLSDITSAPSREGFTLLGYYDASSDGNKVANADGTLVANVTGFTDADGKWTATEDKTLYAQWEVLPETYSVTHTLTNTTKTSGATGADAATEGEDYTAVFAASADYELPEVITVTIGGNTATVNTDYTWNRYTGEVKVNGTSIDGNIVITVSSDSYVAPTSGELFSFAVGTISTTYSLPAKTEINLTDYDSSISNGDVIVGNKSTADDKTRMSDTGGGTICFNGGDAYIKITLRHALKTGDVILFENGSGDQQVCFTTSNSRSTSNITENNKWVATAAFNNAKTIYIWRNEGATYVKSLTIYRNAAIVNIAAGCTDGEKYYATYSNNSAFVVPEDIKVSAIKLNGSKKMSLMNYDTDDVVAAGEGVLLTATKAGNHVIYLSDEEGISKAGNLLVGSGNNGVEASAMADTDYYYYRLTMAGEPAAPGFWWKSAEGAGFVLAANKAYLKILKTEASLARGFSLSDDEGETTGINAALMNNERMNNEVYNLNGQRVAQPTKGLYIVNGRKVVIK